MSFKAEHVMGLVSSLLLGFTCMRKCPVGMNGSATGTKEEDGQHYHITFDGKEASGLDLGDVISNSGLFDIYGPLGKIPGVPAIHEARVAHKLLEVVEDYYDRHGYASFSCGSDNAVVHFSGELLPEGAEV